MILGVLPSMMATAELVVPKSIPITAPLTFSSVDWKRAKLGAAVLLKKPAERVALGSCGSQYCVCARRASKLEMKSNLQLGIGATTTFWN